MTSNTRIAAALCLAASCLCASAYAAPPANSKYAVCMDKAGGVTAEMLNCIGEETKAQDQRLNKSYKALMSTQSPARKKELTEVQRAWVKFRDGNCSFYADPDGGSLAAVSASECVLQMTTDRAAELERLHG